MSIVVKDVTKYFGEQKALDRVSFEIPTGQIVGFLGPNGAGKSTLMKIITCYQDASEGTVEVCGLDVKEQDLEVRKKVGYLPEHNPLYLDMYVKEYLSFVASIYKVKNKKERVKEMIQLVGLEKEQHKKIEALSKGYRQRVGIAQAIIHDPEVVILDEPTSGLDPNQLVDIRNLIKKIGKTKTVMLSTHIMQEVEAICDHIIIIKEGRIVANEDAETIQKSGKKQVVYVEIDGNVSKSALKKIDGVQRVEEVNKSAYLLESNSESDIRKNIAQFGQQNNILFLTIRLEERSLEDIFKELTK